MTGATTLDSTGQYLPLNNPNNSMALGGPLQGHLIGVSTFTNSGIIDLQSNPVAGDVLVITGARQAGVVGPGTFISNGGTLVDNYLDQDISILKVDGTKVTDTGKRSSCRAIQPRCGSALNEGRVEVRRFVRSEVGNSNASALPRKLCFSRSLTSPTKCAPFP